jgi:acyl-CoA reductase-like NAD-dependent aldehyde dehydrogenase
MPIWHGDFESGWANTPPEYVPFPKVTYPTDPTGPDELLEGHWLWPTQDHAVPHEPPDDRQADRGAALAGDLDHARDPRKADPMTAYPALHMMIDGERVAGGGRRTHAVVNPPPARCWANCRWPMRQISTARWTWRRRAFRCGAFHAAAARRGAQGAARLMLERQEDLARIATLEEGKTLAEARIEVLMNVGLFKFYAGEVFRLYGARWCAPPACAPQSPRAGRPGRGLCAVEFPAGQSGRKLGAPIAAGCSVILKAAEETPASALGVLQCLLDAGCRRSGAGGVRRARRGEPAPAGQPGDPQAVFTGSTGGQAPVASWPPMT